VQDGQFTYLGTTGGTADAYTLTPSPSITAYATTQQFTAKISATNTTTTPYLQISGIANPTTTAVIKKLSATKTEIAVETSDLLINGIYHFQRNSANDAWIIINPEKAFYNGANLTKATTTTQGVIEIATNAETAAGTDTERAIVPSALASLFGASSRSTNGYARLPVKVGSAFVEIIIQWGTSGSIGADSTLVVTLPLTFPTAIASVVATGSARQIFGAGNGNSIQAEKTSTSQITLACSGYSQSANWIAIGY
jgi:hypothetical protein